MHNSEKKKYIESYCNDSDSDYIVKNKLKSIKKRDDTESETDSEYIIKNKVKHSKRKEDSESEFEPFEYFIKNKYYRKICNYYEIDLNYKKNNCDKNELNKSSLLLFKNMLKKYSHGRIIIFFQEEK